MARLLVSALLFCCSAFALSSEALIEKIVGHTIRIAKEPFGEKKLLAIGSIMNYAEEGDVIWGAGVNGKRPESAYRFTSLDVRSLASSSLRRSGFRRGFCRSKTARTPRISSSTGTTIGGQTALNSKRQDP